MIRTAYEKGRRDALAKFALAPPTQVDEFVQNVEAGKDIPPPAAPPTALDGTTPLELPKLAGLFGASKAKKKYNAWADEMNRPKNLKKLNDLLAHHGQAAFKKKLSDLSDSEWHVAHERAMGDPHFKAIHAKHFGG